MLTSEQTTWTNNDGFTISIVSIKAFWILK